MKGIKAIVSSILVFIVCSGVSLYADEVGVSFAKNNMVPAIRYYLSQDYSSESEIVVDNMTSPRYMEEGTTIYVRYNNPEASFYEFKGFKIYSYDENGDRSDEIIEIDNKDQITIPDDLYYDQISIEPFGVFKQRTLNLSDTIDGEEKDNIWIIGDDEYTAPSVNINATIPYSVSFKYDPQLYYVVSYSPSNRVVSAGSGSVIFFEENPFAASRRNLVTDYSVQLKPYTYFSFEETRHIKIISVRGEEISAKELQSTPFKIGDTVTIVTDRDWILSGYGIDIKNIAITEDSRVYSVTVIDNNDYNIGLSLTKTVTHTVTLNLQELQEGEQEPTVGISYGEYSSEIYKDLQEKKNFELKDGETLYLRIRNTAASRQKMTVTLVYEDGHTNIDGIGTTEYNTQFKFGNNRATNLQQIKLEIDYGIYFCDVNNDPALTVSYYNDESGEKIKNGDFLPDGTKINFSVSGCPSDKKPLFSDGSSGDEHTLTISRGVTKSDFIVNTTSMQGFMFDPANYINPGHGKLEFSANGTKITTRTFLKNGTELQYKYWADEGYTLSPAVPDHIVVRGDMTNEDLRKIHFIEDEQVILHLNQPLYGGSIIYYHDGREIDVNEISVKAESKIEYKLIADNGFIPVDNKNEDSFKVTKEKEQSFPSENKTMFKEQDEHKPSLTIDINGTSSGFSLNTFTPSDKPSSYISFAIANKSGNIEFTPDENENDVTKEEKSSFLGSNKHEVIVDKDIATYAPTKFEIQGIQLNNNQALKITRSDTIRGQKEPIATSDYVRQSNTNYELSFDYSTDENRTYENVRLTFEIVSGFTHQLRNIPYASLFVELDGKELEEGQFVEPDTEVDIRIIPDEGYYISGRNIENNCYEDTMKYSKYISEISSIISKHPIHEYISMHLPASDLYGSYQYEFNDYEIQNEYDEFKEDDTLKVTFTAKEPYSIKRNLPFLSKTQITVDLKIEEFMNDSQVNPEMLGITLEEAAK